MSAPIWPIELQRPFRALVFDWDGVAVSGRSEPIPHLIDALTRLLDHGVLIIVITGTHLGHLDRQLLSQLPGAGRANLICCTNRGSEVYGFPSGAKPERFHFRQASDQELRALDRAAMSLQKVLFKEFHLHSEVIFDRLNRRKVDLIPIPEWQDPPKSRVRELLAAVEKRLGHHGGIAGLPWLVGRAREIALASGLQDPRVTTDLKHIEIGLTDKSDSSRWVLENVFKTRGIRAHEVCILGDEFGMSGGVSGSDLLLCIPELVSSAVVSVGVEPAGTPALIHHVPGGPESFQDFLDLQLSLLEWGISRDPSWCIEQTNFDPAREREMEALFSVGNGFMGLRGALEIGIPSSESDLYISGVYDAKSTVRPYSELDFLAPERSGSRYAELVSFPFPFRIHAKINQSVLEVREEGLSRHSRTLDLRSGILQIKQEFQMNSLKVEICSRRIASLDDPHRLLHEFELRLSGAGAEIVIDWGVDFNEFQIRHPHLEVLDTPISHLFSELILAETRASGISIGVGSRTQVDGVELSGRKWSGWIENGQSVKFRRITVAVTDRGRTDEGRETRISQLKTQLWDRLEAHNFHSLHRWLADHRRAWVNFWRRADIPFSGNPGLTESQRFNAYHLRISAPVNSQSSVPARGLSGRGYEGHIFWDAEIFVLPFFALQFPEFARRLLQYRHQTLPGARRRAKMLGYRGACFAWESTVDGEDVTPEKILLKTQAVEIPIFTGSQQIHVTADIAYGVWNYWYCTGDVEFMRNFGVEILFETARFWVSRCSKELGRYHINNVVGPDEYHHSVRDNAYTNWMARFNLKKAIWARDWLAESDPIRLREVCNSLGFTHDDFREWAEVAQQLYLPQPGENGLIEQFEGFFQLRSVEIEKSERLKSPVRRLLDWEQVNASRICKQADVLMLPFLFPDHFSDEVVRANYQYYEPITDHGSSLSPPVHALIAARIGATEDAASYYAQSVELDLFNLMQNTSLGVHAACMGGSWQALVFGLMGVRLGDSGPSLKPNGSRAIPKEWGSLKCKLLFRGKEHEIEASAA